MTATIIFLLIVAVICLIGIQKVYQLKIIIIKYDNKYEITLEWNHFDDEEYPCTIVRKSVELFTIKR